MPRLRRTHALFVAVDPFFSPRGKVLHHFEEFLSGASQAGFPCIWLTSQTRAQLDEPRRRLGQSDPFIGESGSGVYLPEDYFHLKSRATIRLGRFTCMPIAKPQPAAAEALEELAADTGVSVVALRGLTLRELSQNTGLPGSEAERVRMRDFDELFFFAGATAEDTQRFQNEAKVRGLTLQNSGAFWSLSAGADYGKCIRELGGLYDRAVRGHALRTAIISAVSEEEALSESNSLIRSAAGACDHLLVLCERQSSEPDQATESQEGDPAKDPIRATGPRPHRTIFHLHSPSVWEDVLEWLQERS